MPNFKFLVLLVLTSLPFFSISQSKGAISGIVFDKENNEPLPFASVTLKNHPIGTLSNEEGEFDFYIPASKRNDTIQVSFIGFINYEIPIAAVSGKLVIQLQPSNEVLEEVVLSKLSPLDYIKNALANIDQNYPQDPFQTIAYYREKFIENGNLIGKKEAVFKSYYTANADTAKNQHQILLYKPTDNRDDFQFMRDFIDKKIEKERKKAEKKGDDFEDFDFESGINMGGPEMIIEMADLRNEESKNNFLNPKHFNKYDYTFGEEKYFNGDILVTIHYKAKKKIESVKDEGIILITKGDYAIASIQGSGVLTIPIAAKPVLFLVGLSVSNPKFKNTVNYQKYKDKWYPKLLRWDAEITLKKRHMFKSNEHANLKIGQVFFINKLDSIAIPVPKAKRFDTEKGMEDQIYNDLNISWESMNIIKD